MTVSGSLGVSALSASVLPLPLSLLTRLMSQYNALEPFDRLVFHLLSLGLLAMVPLLSAALVPCVRLAQRQALMRRVLGAGALVGGASCAAGGALAMAVLPNGPEPLTPPAAALILGVLGALAAVVGLGTLRLARPSWMGEVWDAP